MNNQATLKALRAHIFNCLMSDYQIELFWAPGYCGVFTIEIADELAR